MRSFGLILGEEKHDLGTKREIRSPYDNRVVGEVSFGTHSLLEDAIGLAHERFPEFAREPAHKRSAWLRAIAKSIQAHADELAQIISDEAGKPISLARAEAARAGSVFSIAAEEALRIPGELLSLDQVPDGTGRLGLVRRVPVGPIAAISPFNFPLNLVAHKVASALAAGNTIVVKPASQTPMSAIMLGRMALECGLPPGILSVVPCPASQAQPLVEDPRMRMLSFTGSAEVGWSLKALAGRKKVLLELGGNAAAIVERDADIETAARRLALGAFIYAGQICISVQRIFIQERAASRFYDAFLEAARNHIPCGDPSDETVRCGPMIDAANADRILEWIDQAVSTQEAKLLLAPQREGNVVTPVVLTKVPEQLPIVAREAFGPVVVVETYRALDPVFAKVNASIYGLQAAIFTNNVQKTLRAFEELEVGAIIHNDYPTYRVDPMPYGGVKESGMGREGPRYAIEEMTERRLLVLNAGT
ncbi:MAG: aldehyde dehydrogenase family protein [Candidatus Eisenbacteria sp.]|nr:aldehyde dehydrogenase family protein [Candidatus Eisenbacteria bacterium]